MLLAGAYCPHHQRRSLRHAGGGEPKQMSELWTWKGPGWMLSCDPWVAFCMPAGSPEGTTVARSPPLPPTGRESQVSHLRQSKSRTAAVPTAHVQFGPLSLSNVTFFTRVSFLVCLFQGCERPHSGDDKSCCCLIHRRLRRFRSYRMLRACDLARVS